jgi:hypothetical protein
MTTLSEAKTILEGDSTLLSTATGGVWDWDELGRLGLNRTNTPAAFDSNEIIKPCVVLKWRSSTPDYELVDDANQFVSLVDMLEAWAYEDDGYSNIRTMLERVYVLLHAQVLGDDAQVKWAGDSPQLRDDDLDACVQRSDYQVYTSRSV